MLQKSGINKLIIGPLVACVSLVTGMYVYLGVTNHPNHFWRKASTARITIDGQLSPGSRAYRHPDGKVLVRLDETSWYAFIPEVNNVGACNPIRSIAFPGYIYAYDWGDKTIPCAMMGDGVKSDVKTVVNTQPESLEFTSLDRQRIRVSW